MSARRAAVALMLLASCAAPDDAEDSLPVQVDRAAEHQHTVASSSD